MHYEKPIVMDLSIPAKAAGQEPESCINGTVPAGLLFCQTGGTPMNTGDTCNAGPQPGAGGADLCVAGDIPASSYCEIGTGATLTDFCTTGPSPV